MAAALAVVVLPAGREAPAGAHDATLASVRAEAGADVPVLELGPAALDAGELLAFVRPGDRWLPGALAARRRPLEAHPTAVLGVAGHVRLDAGGEPVLTVRAPAPPVDPAELLLRPCIEPSATLVRSAALAPDALELLARPHGDAVLWSRLTREHGLLASGEIAAEVALDRDRHGHAPAARTAALLEAIAGGERSPGLRRELLRRLYLEPELELAPLELASLLAGGTDAAELVADLQWALERQRDALAAERVRWPYGDAAPDEALPLADEELVDLRTAAVEFGAEIAVRDAKIRRLEAEVYRRDAIIANATAAEAGA